MANINKSGVIQLADCGIIDIVTEFDEQYISAYTGCPTCGYDEYYTQIQTARVITTGETRVVTFFQENYWTSVVEEVTEDGGNFKLLLVTEADLIQLLLNKETLETLKEKTLDQFCEWLQNELEVVATHRWAKERYSL